MKIVFFDGSLELGKRMLEARGIKSSDICPISLDFGVSAMRAVVHNLPFSPSSNTYYLLNSFEALDNVYDEIKKNFNTDLVLTSTIMLRKDGTIFDLSHVQSLVESAFDALFKHLKHSDKD